MIERALASVNVLTNEHYINRDTFKLFKVHGSVHWPREVDTEIENIKERNVWDVASELIKRIADLKVSERYRMVVDTHPISKVDEIPLFPAIAIPVETKRDFECPADHLDCLRAHLKNVSHILLIGWRSTEAHFLALLRDGLAGRAVPVQVVAGKKKSADEILARMHDAGITHLPPFGSAVDGGFTEYVVSREAEKFLAK